MDHFFPFIDLLTIACQHHLMDTWFMHFSEVPAKYWFRSCVCPGAVGWQGIRFVPLGDALAFPFSLSFLFAGGRAGCVVQGD